MTRRNVETVRLGKTVLGVVIWDHRERTARFSPYMSELKPLARESWDCPVTARTAAIRYWQGREQ